MSARDTLLGMLHEPQCYTMPQAELVPLQLEAARELFAERRQQLPILDRRAREVGIERIESFDDVIPLLFSHTTFKSYPNSFMQNGTSQTILIVEGARAVNWAAPEDIFYSERVSPLEQIGKHMGPFTLCAMADGDVRQLSSIQEKKLRQLIIQGDWNRLGDW